MSAVELPGQRGQLARWVAQLATLAALGQLAPLVRTELSATTGQPGQLAHLVGQLAQPARLVVMDPLAQASPDQRERQAPQGLALAPPLG